MTFRRGYLAVRLAAAAVGAAASACARRAAPGPDAAAVSRAADSTRSAASDRSRSSATDVATFTVAESARFTRVEQMIAARFPSVRVVPQGNEYTIRIRGTGSLGSSNEPLVIIDGAHRTTADLRSVDTRDVARIEVIKDSGAALYGVRGANGVIVISTRRGR